MTHDQVICGLGLHTPAKGSGWHDMTCQLAMFEVRALRVPHQAARGHRRPEEPAAQTLVRRARRHVLRDQVTDLLARARCLRGEAEDVRMHTAEISEQRTARRSPC